MPGNTKHEVDHEANTSSFSRFTKSIFMCFLMYLYIVVQSLSFSVFIKEDISIIENNVISILQYAS